MQNTTPPPKDFSPAQVWHLFVVDKILKENVI